VVILVNLKLNVAVKRTLKLNSASKGGVGEIPASLDWLDKIFKLNRLAQRVCLFLL
jgi:hypothetical protein